jgi:hypothetical protein
MPWTRHRELSRKGKGRGMSWRPATAGRTPTNVGRAGAPGVAVLIGGVLLALAQPVRADRSRIAVLPLEIAGDITASRVALEEAVAKGAAVAGQPLVPAEAVAGYLATGATAACQVPACWMAVGKAVAASYLLAGSVERADGMFRARFRLVQASDGLVLGSEESECEEDDCSVAELCRLTAREIVRKILGPSPSGSRPPSDPALVPSAAGGDPVEDRTHVQELEAASEPALARPRADLPLWRRVGPPVAIGAGVIAIATGAFLVKGDGACAEYTLNKDGERVCDKLKDTLGWGVGVLGAGAALVATGLVFTIRGTRRDGAGTNVVIGPGRIALSGRF